MFLFFDPQNDQKWLHNLGIVLAVEFPNSSQIDIQEDRLAHAIRDYKAGGKPKISAEDLFIHLRFAVTAQHNGGNDAVYELRAYIAGLKMVDPLTGNITFPDNPPRLAVNGQELKDKTIEPETAQDGNEKTEIAQDGNEKKEIAQDGNEKKEIAQAGNKKNKRSKRGRDTFSLADIL